MFALRQAAGRVLSSRSSSLIARPRTFTTATFVASKPSRIVSSVQFQRRWASSEETKKEVPVSELQPTPQEEVENAIHEDNAAVEAAAESAEPAQVNSRPVQSNLRTEAADAFGARQNSFGERPPVSPKTTIYVGNLFFDVTENDLNKEFGRYGTVQSARLIRDARGLSKGFGYVKFASIDEATTAINEMNQQLYEGRRIVVNFSNTEDREKSRGFDNSRPTNPPSKTLFIGNMSYEMTDRDLNALFKGIRNVIDVRVAIDRKTGQPRGFAHADFVDVKSAMDAASVLGEKESYGRRLRIDYSVGPSANAAPRNTPR